MNYVDDLFEYTKKGKFEMITLRERFDNIQQEKQEVINAFNIIKQITDGQFTHDGNDITYHGSDEHCQAMLQQFDTVKPVLFYTRNNKWLVMEYLAEHKEYMNGDKPYSLAQLVSILLGFQGEVAFNNDDNDLIDTLHIEACIWGNINTSAKYKMKKAS